MIPVITCNEPHSSPRAARAFRRSAPLAALAVLVLHTSAALAQPANGDSAAAEALFQDARKLVKEGKYAEGCPKFEASLALYPSASTMLNIADCREREGKVAGAWEAFHRALVLNRETRGEQRRSSIEEAAKQGISALEPRLPRLLINVSGAPPGLKVLRDGKELPAATLGEALPADPGTHEIRLSAPGYRSETRSVTLVEGKTETIEVSLTAASSTGTKSQGIPTWVWVTGGAGIALAGVGAVFLADNRSAVSALSENCPSNESGTRCAPGYDFESDNARKNRSLALFLGLGGTGVIAIGAATVGLIVSSSSAPSSKERSAKPPPVTGSIVIAPGGGGATLSGRF